MKAIAIRLGIIVGLLFVLALISYYFKRFLVKKVSTRGTFLWLAFIPTVLHETMHIIGCLLTLTPIYEIHLFHPEGDTLGSVVHGDMGVVRNTIIGLFPLIGSSTGLYLLFALWFNKFHFSLEVFKTWHTYLFIFIALICVFAMQPSREDIRELPLFLIVVAFISGCIWWAWPYIAKTAQKHYIGAVNVLNKGIVGLATVAVISIIVTGAVICGEWVYRKVKAKALFTKRSLSRDRLRQNKNRREQNRKENIWL